MEQEEVEWKSEQNVDDPLDDCRKKFPRAVESSRSNIEIAITITRAKLLY
jgi:hypothetical protein